MIDIFGPTATNGAYPPINIIGWDVQYDDGTPIPDPPNSVRLREPPENQAAVMRQIGMCVRFARCGPVEYLVMN